MKPLALPLRGLRPLLAVALVLHFAPAARAATSVWTNNSGGNFTNAANWLLGGVPGVADIAAFTNNNKFQVNWTSSITNNSAFFNGRGGTVTQAVGTSTWLLTNTYVVGQNALSTATVTHVSGTLSVFNSAAGARIIIGQNGNGTFNLNGGVVVADQVLVTNNGAGFTNSTFNFNSGFLTTLHGSVITQALSFSIGTISNQTASWTMLGGTNSMNLGNASVLLGDNVGATGIVHVNGPSTVWAVNKPIDVGDAGQGQLFITNGATVSSSNGILGVLATSGSNLVRVSGTNTRWLMNGNLVVGSSGAGNQAVFESGAFVSNGIASIGSGAGSSNNSVLATGANTLWFNGGSTLSVGGSGSANTLTVSNAAAVSGANLLISSGAGSSNNLVRISGGVLTVSNGIGTGQLNLGVQGVGQLDFNGGTITADRLLVTNNGAGFTNSIFSFGSGVLTTLSNSTIISPALFQIGATPGTTSTWNMLGGTTLISNLSGNVFVGNGVAAAGRVVVNGPSTVWTNNATVNVDSTSGGSEVLVTNGGRGFSTAINLGNTGGADGNRLLITGTNSVWTVASPSAIGSSTASNRVSVVNGGQFSGSVLDVGLSSFASNNVLAVSNAGSLVALNSLLTVGNDGSGNQLLILAGGQVNNLNGVIGSTVSSSNNVALVSGAGSVWSNIDITVGLAGGRNTLTVSNGGAAGGASLVVGALNTALGNAVNVSGGSLTISNAAHTALLDVRRGSLTFNGGTVTADLLLATNNGAGFTNSIFNFNHGTLTTLSNSTVVSPGNFIIGNTAGQVAVWNMLGGTTLTTNLSGSVVLGSGSGAAGRVIVDGPSTVWSNLGTLVINAPGSGSEVMVTNGARAFTSNLLVGTAAGFNGARVTIGGASSRMNATGGGINIGSASASNELRVVNGGTFVANNGVAVGSIAAASNNVLSVSGSNSLVSIAGALDVGSAGGGNQLLILDGGRLTNSSLVAGVSSASNSILVTGVGSRLQGGSGISVGSSGSFNDLTIAGGGQASDDFGRLGVAFGSGDNTALVTGAGSLWSNATGLTVGQAGTGNTLTLSNSGTAIANADVIVSSNPGASNNTLNVFGGSLVATNAAFGNLNVGAAGSGTLNLSGGDITVRSLLVTNNGAGFTNSIFNFNHGTLTTLSNSTIVSPANFTIGTTAGQTAEWRMPGGTIFITNLGGNVAVGNSVGTGRVWVDGASTLWSNSSILFVNSPGTGSEVVVTNGARGASSNLFLGTLANSANNRFTIVGANSRWDVTPTGTGAINLGTQSGATNNQLSVLDGGTLVSPQASVGAGSTASNNLLLVSGTNSQAIIGSLQIGGSTMGNQMLYSMAGR